MYESLLLETGGGIISETQLSPQQGDACVMIGIGGTGIDAIRKLKKEIYQRIEPDAHTDNSVPQYRKIKFLAIDTDSKNLDADNYDASAISPNEKFSIHDPYLLSLLEQPEVLHQKENMEWISDGLRLAGADGAGGVRQAGRYCLMKKSSALRARITQLIADAMAEAGRAEINIHIFAGLSGGTGSGCFLDVCYIVREIVKEMSARIFGYFFLPDVQLNRYGIRGIEAVENLIKANGYAALKELDYLMSLPSSNETFEANYGGFVVKSNKAPVDLCHLISGTNSEGVLILNSYDYALNVVADYVLSYLSKVDADEDIDLKFVAPVPKVIKPKYGAERNYHILGASSAELPLTHIGAYLAGKTYEKLVPNLSRHSSNEMVLKFANRMGYTFEGMRNLLIDGVNFKPVYNMDMIDDLGKLNETANDWNLAISAITIPIANCMQAANGKILTNANDQTQELQSYDYSKLTDIENPTFAINLFKQLILCCLSENGGPTMATELLHSEVSKDLTNIMDGIITVANDKQHSYEANLELRVQDICTAAHSYNKARIGRIRRIEGYLDARDAMLSCQIEIEVCKKVASMCDYFKAIIKDLYENYFSPMRTMISELDDTFKANIEWLNTPEKLINKDYCWRIFELSDIRDTLDETVLKQQQMDVEHSEFVNYLIAHFNEWKSQDKYRTARCINEYMINHFNETLSQTVDTFLSMKFGQVPLENLVDEVQTSVLDKVRSKAAPLFWVALYYHMDDSNTFKQSTMSIPKVSTVIQLAADNIGDATMFVRKCNIGDRITCLNLVSGVPLFAYQGIYELKDVYDKWNYPGLHLHERDINWKETLPTPIPYHFDPEATKNGREYAQLYHEAVQKKVICCSEPYNPDEYVVRQIPDQTEVLSQYTKERFVCKGNILESELLNAISDLKALKVRLLPDIVPENRRIPLKNDGYRGSEGNFSERVRIDYFVRFGGIRKVAERSLDNLKKIDDKISEMEGWMNWKDPILTDVTEEDMKDDESNNSEVKEIKIKMQQLKSLFESGILEQDIYDLSMQKLKQELNLLMAKEAD